MRLLWTLAALAVLASAGATLAQQGNSTRVALLIGNAKYPDAEAPLKEPAHDAKALAEELGKSDRGFGVEVGENLNKDAMRKAFDRLYRKIKPGTEAVVFFSGFAIQSARQTYLVPVDAQIWTEPDVRRDGLSLDAILKEMNSRGAKVKIAILDASRRNPFERRFRPFSAGLAPVDAPTGSMVMYSSAPSTVINNSDGERGVFVGELIAQIRSAQSIEEVFNRTRAAVTKASHGLQVPWSSSSLTSDFSFSSRFKAADVPSKPTPAATPPRPTTTAPRPVELPKMDPVAAPNPPLAAEVKPAPAEPAPAANTYVSNAPAITTPEPVTAPSLPITPMEPVKVLPVPSMPEEERAAVQDLDRRLKANSKDAAALYRRGQLYAKNYEFTRALLDFDALLKLNPKDAEALNNRCWIRAVIGELNSALQDCDASLRLKPNLVDTLDSRGFVKLRMGQPQAAISDYDAALRLSASHAPSLYGRGLAKLRIGNTGGNNDIAAAKVIDPNVADDFNRFGVH